MEKLMKMLEQLMPLLAFYPPWVKAFFAVSIAFLLASLFMFVVLYPSASKRKNEQSAKSEISVDISVMPGGDTGNQSTTPPASTQSRTPEPGVGNQSTANADNQSTKPEANTGDQSTSRPAADTVNLPPRPGGATDIQPMTPADGRGNQSTSRRDLSRDLTTLTYSVESTDQQIKIRPQMPYLSILANGGPIEDNGYFRSPFEVSLPNLDIKIVNNSNKTIFLTRALFEVEDSTPDTSPVFIVHAGYNSHFTIVNEGWGKVSNCLIKFNVIPFTE
ncbi:MAG: hypothetical protein J2P41_11855, partial [Blastocatellia bacterium]|nr:hypothetical protein [Blastocatellia bacterium]